MVDRSSYDQANKPRPYWTVAADVVAKGATMPKKRLVPLLREVSQIIRSTKPCFVLDTLVYMYWAD